MSTPQTPPYPYVFQAYRISSNMCARMHTIFAVQKRQNIITEQVLPNNETGSCTVNLFEQIWRTRARMNNIIVPKYIPNTITNNAIRNIEGTHTDNLSEEMWKTIFSFVSPSFLFIAPVNKKFYRLYREFDGGIFQTDTSNISTKTDLDVYLSESSLVIEARDV